MKRKSRKRVLRHVGLSSAIAATVLVSGVGVASAATHPSRPAAALMARSSKDAATTASLMRAHESGVGGDVTALTPSSITLVNFDGTSLTYAINSSTSVTDRRASDSSSNLSLGENVLVVVNPADSSAAGSITIVPADRAGRMAGPGLMGVGAFAVTAPVGENEIGTTTRGAVRNNRSPK